MIYPIWPIGAVAERIYQEIQKALENIADPNVEVDQPESEFIFRMKNGPACALFEADGGAWKLFAMENIKEYLQNALKTEIENGKIIIIA